MSYTPNIPVTGDSLGGTKDRIRSNFQLVSSVFGNNHVTYGLSGQGKHNYLQMPEVTASGVGVPVTSSNEGALYDDVGVTPLESNLFFRGENNGKIYQLTRADEANKGTFGNNTNYYMTDLRSFGGWTFLPGGLVLQYGRFIQNNSFGTVNFPIPFPSTLAPFSLVITAEVPSSSSAVAFSLISRSASSFIYRCSANAAAMNWVAIGN